MQPADHMSMEVE